MLHNQQMRVAPVFLLVISSLVIQQVDSYQPAPRIDDTSAKHSSYGAPYKLEKNKKAYFENTATTYNQSVQQDARNEPEERIQVSEPYKSLIQTTVRFALAQSGAVNHVNIETAMDLLNDTGFMLSKPSTLSKFAKALTVILATLLTSAFLFPSAYKTADTAWRNPHKFFMQFERYLPNGINERTVINIVGSRAEDFLANVGLTDSSCREQSICQAGELLRCTFPNTSEQVIKFVADHFSRPRYRENKYIDLFLVGFVDQNCPSLMVAPASEHQESRSTRKSCFGNILSSYFLSKCSSNSTSQPTQKSEKQPKVEYQTIQAGRALAA